MSPNPNHNPTAKRLGRQLAEIRQAAGLSQRALAKSCGVAQAQVCNAESGRFDTQVGKLEMFLNELGHELTVKEKEHADEEPTARDA